MKKFILIVIFLFSTIKAVDRIPFNIGEKLIFDGGKEGAATWRLGHGEVKFEMFHIDTTIYIN